MKLPVGQIVHLGRIVGRVEAVATLAANAIEPTPDFGARVRTDSRLARAKAQGAAKTRRAIAGVFAPDPVQALAQAIWVGPRAGPEAPRPAATPDRPPRPRRAGAGVCK